VITYRVPESFESKPSGAKHNARPYWDRLASAVRELVTLLSTSGSICRELEWCVSMNVSCTVR
jgi:hypothetical protein